MKEQLIFLIFFYQIYTKYLYLNILLLSSYVLFFFNLGKLWKAIGLWLQEMEMYNWGNRIHNC